MDNITLQITLGEFISLLEKVKDQKVNIGYDFGWFIPTKLNSYRGYYDEIALGYERGEIDDEPTVASLLKELKSAVGKTFMGWKGGEFIMIESTPIWVDNFGDGAPIGIIGILDLDWKVIIVTKYINK